MKLSDNSARLLVGVVAGAALAALTGSSAAAAKEATPARAAEATNCAVSSGQPTLFGWTLFWSGKQECTGSFAAQSVEVTLQRHVDGAWYDYTTDTSPATTGPAASLEKSAYLGIPGASTYRTKVTGWSGNGTAKTVAYSPSVVIVC